MKGKRYTTEDKIRIFRAVDSGQAILDVCREHNLSEVRFHRWKRQFGQMEINEARRLKELERENSELKKMLAESLLKNRVLEFVCKKNSTPGTAARSGATCGCGPAVFRAVGHSRPAKNNCANACGSCPNNIPGTAIGGLRPYSARQVGRWVSARFSGYGVRKDCGFHPPSARSFDGESRQAGL